MTNVATAPKKSRKTTTRKQSPRKPSSANRTIEQYKREILPFWRLKTPQVSKESAKKIYSLFVTYKQQYDFIGMDMARKFLQMGFTLARRYANHPAGKKYDIVTRKPTQQASDWKTSDKALSASIFYKFYRQAADDKVYQALKHKHLSKDSRV